MEAQKKKAAKKATPKAEVSPEDKLAADLLRMQRSIASERYNRALEDEQNLTPLPRHPCHMVVMPRPLTRKKAREVADCCSSDAWRLAKRVQAMEALAKRLAGYGRGKPLHPAAVASLLNEEAMQLQVDLGFITGTVKSLGFIPDLNRTLSYP